MHLVADILHLLAAGAWLGSLIPLALLLAEARRIADPDWKALARRAVRRFSILAAASVAVLFTAGLVNTWFLAGSVPALIGTLYGRLLLAKIAIFATMVIIGAVNLLRMEPRLAPAAGGGRAGLWAAAVDHLRRNALVEAALGLIVLAIVGLLGILPPGLHTEPGWPLPFRLDFDALATSSEVQLAILAGLAGICLIAAVATGAAGLYRRMMAAWGGLALCLGFGAIVLRPAIEPAFPTSYYAPAEAYAAASVEHGAHLYAENCAVCHGADGRGDGPAAAGLAVHPADLTAPHLFAHTPGDLFWWVSNGRGNGAMPGFAGVMSPAERWDVINFVRARAAGALSRQVGPQVSTAATSAIPDFAFESRGRQQTLAGVLKNGPALLALFSRPPPAPRLAQLAATQKQSASRVRILAIDLAPAPIAPETETPAPLVRVSQDVMATLLLFRAADDGGETDLLLDRAGESACPLDRQRPSRVPRCRDACRRHRPSRGISGRTDQPCRTRALIGATPALHRHAAGERSSRRSAGRRHPRRSCRREPEIAASGWVTCPTASCKFRRAGPIWPNPAEGARRGPAGHECAQIRIRIGRTPIRVPVRRLA